MKYFRSKQSPSDKEFKSLIAKEACVKEENLDFYMAKFYRKTILESKGIDTSGIDSDVTDTEEWLRYCYWEIKNSMEFLERYKEGKIFLSLEVDENDEPLDIFIDGNFKCHTKTSCDKFTKGAHEVGPFTVPQIKLKFINGEQLKFCPYCIEPRLYDYITE